MLEKVWTRQIDIVLGGHYPEPNSTPGVSRFLCPEDVRLPWGIYDGDLWSYGVMGLWAGAA